MAKTSKMYEEARRIALKAEEEKKKKSAKYGYTEPSGDGSIYDEVQKIQNSASAQVNTIDAYNAYKNVLNSLNLYSPGVSNRIRQYNMPGVLDFSASKANTALPYIGQHQGASQQATDILTGMANEISANAPQYAMLAKARSGNTSVLEGKKGQEKRDLTGLTNLYGYDQNTAALAQQHGTSDFEELSELSKSFNLQDALLTVEDYYRMINTPVMGDGLSAAKVDEADYEKAASDIERMTGISVRDLAPDKVEETLAAVGGMSDTVDYMQSYMRTQEAWNQEQQKQAEYNDFVNKSYEEAAADPEFAAKSQFIESESNPLYRAVMLEPGSEEQRRAVTDLGYDWWARANGIAPLLGWGTDDSYGFEYMDDKQRQVFASKWANKDYNGAVEYLKGISWGVNKQKYEASIEAAKEYAGENWGNSFLASAASVGQNFAGEIEGMYNAGREALGLGINEYDPSFMNTGEAQAKRQAVGEKLAASTQGMNLFGKNVPQMAYNALMSAADSTLNAMTLGSAASPAMGFGAFNSSFQQNLMDGKSDKDAFIDALVEGGIEMGTEYFSIDALMSDSSSPMGYFLRNLLTEPSEEITGFAVGEIYDALKNGADSRVNKRIDELRTMGYSPEDAKMQAAREMLADLFETGFTALLSGETMALGGAVKTGVENVRVGNDVIENNQTRNMLEVAQALDLPEDVQRLVQEQLAILDAEDQAKQAKNNHRRTEETMRDPVEQEAEIDAEQVQDGAADLERETEDLENQVVINEARQEDLMREPAEADTEADVETVTEADSEAKSVDRSGDEQAQQRINEARQEAQMREPATAKKGKQQPANKSGSKAQDTAKSNTKLSSAAIGRIYRESFKALDAAAQDVLSNNYARYLENELTRKNNGRMPKNVVKLTTKAMSDLIAGRNITEEQRKLIVNSSDAIALLKEATGSLGGYQTKAANLAQMRSTKYTPFDLEAVAKENYGKNADVVLNGIQPDQDEQTYAEQFGMAYQYGMEGRNMDIVKNYGSVSALTPTQVEAAFKLGRDARVTEDAAAEKVRSGVTVGNIDTTALRGVKLNKAQKNAVYAAGSLAKALNINIKFVRHTANAQGKITGKNGKWSPTTRTLTLDVNAGRLTEKSTNYAIMQAMSHELTHYIKQFADADLWNQYQDFVIGHMSEKMDETKMNAKIGEYIARWAAAGKTLDRDGAIEEIIADASGDALLGMTEQDFADLARSKPGLVEKIRGFIERWAKAVKNAIKSAYEGQTEKSEVAKQMEDAVDELSRKWIELLKNAAKNAQQVSSEQFTVTEQGAVVAPEVAKIMDSDAYAAPDNGLFSIRETDAWAKAHKEQYPDDKAFDQNRALIEQFDRDVAANSVLRYLVPHGRIPKTVRGPLRNNVEYVYTFDMDTKCERTYQFLAYRDAIQKRIGRQLNEDEARNLIELMRAYGQMIPCTYCYVESKRMKLAELYMKYIAKNGESIMGAKYSAEQVFDIVEGARSIVSGYLDDRFNIEDNYSLDASLANDSFAGYRDFEMPITEEAAVQEICDRYNITDKAAKRVIAGYVAEWVYNRRMDLPMNLVNTDVDFRTDSINESVLAFHDLAGKAAQGGAKAKGIENYEPYVDQLKNISVEDKQYMVGMGGIRKHSSNDFQIQNVQDYMLFFMDLAADKRGGIDWTGHTYTKNLDYAHIFAPTNDRINVSIAMYGDNKTGIRPNTQEGVEWEELKTVRKQYKNVGAMAMITNNDQLSFALNSDWIDMIIPFHASGMKRSLYYDVLAWTDYTSKQSERLYTNGQMIERLRQKGIKVNSSAKAADVQRMFMENFDVKVVYNEKTGKRVAPHFFPGETVQHGVKIPGHNNDAQRYFELCEQYGTNPRFFGVKVQDANGDTIDVTQHPSYLKLIKETARTDFPQEPIVAKFDMDYVNKAMKDFKGYANLAEDSYGIVDEFIREYAGKKRKVGDLTERAKQYKAVREEMAAEEAQKRAEQRGEMLQNINDNNLAGAFDGEFADDSDVKFSVRDTSDEASTMRDQLRNNVSALNKMEPVADKTVQLPEKRDKTSKIEWAMKQLEESGYEVERPGFGKIVFDRKRIKTSLGYIHSDDDGRLAAIVAIPEVLESGVEVGVHYDHKDRRYPSITFAAPVIINGVRGNMAVAVIQTNANNYRAHRILMPDGSGFEFVQKNNAVSGTSGRADDMSRLNQSTGSASENSIADFDENVNYQLRDPDQITNREILANLMDNAAENEAELDFVRRYRKQIEQLNEKQAQLDETNAAIVEARKNKASRDEIFKLQNKADILGKQIDRMDGKLLQFEAGKPLQAVVARERAAMKRKADERVKAYAAKRVETVKKQEAEKRERLNQKLAEVREKRDQKLKELRHEKQEAVKKVREEKDESFGKDKYRKRIAEDITTLRTWVTSPTNKEHVPQFLRKPLGDLINALDFSSVRSLNGGEATQNDAKLTAALDAMNVALSQLREQQNGIDQGAASFATIIDLPFGYHEAFIQLTAEIKTRMETTKTTGDIPINRMTASQLKELSVAIRTLTTSIRQMNRLLANAKYDSAVNAANSTIDELGKMTAKKLTYKAVDAVGKFMDWTNTVPYYAFKRFGKGGMAIFDGLMNGWDKLAFNSDKLVKFANDTYKPKEVKKWSSEIRSVDLSNGETVQMTTAQLMSLYCLSKRAQAVGHLLGGGIRIADIESKGRKLAQSDNYTLTEADLNTFANMLTDRQRQVADELQHFMSTQCAEWGNAVSMKRFGYEMFTERYYFPIETDSNNRKAVDEQAEETSLFRLLNMSATKALVKNANNALVVRDIFDVFTAHSSDMAKYNALGLEILDALKWLNYVERTPNDDGTVVTRSVQKSLERAYGKDARQYIIQLIRDLNGVKEGGNDAGFMNKLVSNSKVASVANNVRVWLLQATSMPRAAYAINPKYLSIGLAKMAVHLKKGVKAAQDKVGIAKWKSMGFYDTNISRTVREMVKHDDNVPDKIRKWTMAPAGLMDSLVMGALYYAAEAECKEKYRNTPVGSAAWDKLVNDRMREIVYQTQVVDSTMTRSAAMRSQNSLLKTATSFMSEPTLTMNMLMDSVYEARMNRRAGESLKAPTAKMVKAMSVYIFTAVLVAVAESAFDAERDDDEYETFDEKFITAFIGDLTENDSGWERFTKLLFSNVGANLNPLNNIPVISEFMSIGEGYDSTSMWTQWFGNLRSGYDAYNRWREGKGTWYSWVYSGLKGVSQLVGLPVSNTAREVVSVWNTFFADQYDMPRIQTYSNNKGDAAEAYYNAITDGDSERAAYILKRAQINGISEDNIGGSLATYVKNDYVAGNITEAVARKYLAQYAGKSADKIDDNIKEWTYQRETGHKYDEMKQDYISGAISKTQMQQLLMQYRGYDSDEVYFKLSEWDYEKTTGDEGGKYDWFLDAVDSGSGYEKRAQDLLNHGVDKSDIARSISGAYKDAYLEIKGTPEGDRMLEYLLDVYESIGYDREYERKYISKNWK